MVFNILLIITVLTVSDVFYFNSKRYQIPIDVG